MENLIFDKKDIYKEKIAPLVQELNAVCASTGIPFVVSFAVANTTEKTSYVNSCVTPNFFGIRLTDNKFGHILNAMNGGKYTANEELLEKEFAELNLN